MIEVLTGLLRSVFGEIPQFSVVILMLSLVAASCGFGRPPWFFGVGSGFAAAAMSAATILAYRHRLEVLAGAQLGLLLVHGGRLSAFLIMREHKPSFRRQMLTQHTSGPMRFGVRAVVWVVVSLLYFCMFSPALYATVGRQLLITPATIAFQVLGLTAMVSGFLLEVAADSQKSLFKAYQPDGCCYSGLYGWVRQPNHFGELLFWTGNFLAGTGFYLSPMHWLIGAAGLTGNAALIIAIAVRLENSRAGQYGALDEYHAYVRTVPVLIPWLPPGLFSPARPGD